jgi:hypothetical protein
MNSSRGTLIFAVACVVAGALAAAAQDPPLEPPADAPKPLEPALPATPPNIPTNLPIPATPPPPNATRARPTFAPRPVPGTKPTNPINTNHAQPPIRSATADLPPPLESPPPDANPFTSNPAPGVLRLEPLEDPDDPFHSTAPRSIDSIPRRTAPNRLNPDAEKETEPALDPEVRAEIRRRTERQIREALGRQLRDLEVAVKPNGKIEVDFRTRWFWQRRAAKQTIESLPITDRFDLRVLDR